MFVPFIFTMDTFKNADKEYMHWRQFYLYADACIKNKWPIISHERYFKRLSVIEEKVFEVDLRSVVNFFKLSESLTTENMLLLRAYHILQVEEDELAAKYLSKYDCWEDLLTSKNAEFENIIGELLDRITADFDEKPEGILIYEYLPKALLNAAKKRGIPVIFQGGGVLRRPLAPELNGFSLINDNSDEFIKSKYDKFLNINVPMLSRKGLLRLFISEKYKKDIHHIDNEPEYDAGVLYNNAKVASQYAGRESISDSEMSKCVKEKYDKVLIRTRPSFEPTDDTLDDSPTCFHFCCRCERVVGFSTKGVFEAMLAGRIAHEYGFSFFHSFCNDNIEDESKGVAPTEFLNFVLFGLCTPFEWLTDPDYLQFLVSNPSETELYMRSFEYYTHSISRDDLNFYYMSDNRAYRLGDPLYFTSGHKPHEYGAYYCTGGLLSAGQVDHTWGEGEITSFEFDLTEPVDEPLTISAALYGAVFDLNSATPSQTVICEVNGFNCGSMTLTPGSKYMRFTVPPEYFADKLKIIFRYSYLHIDDKYKISIAFDRMYISLPGQRAIENAMLEENLSLSAEIERLSDIAANLEAQIQSIYNSRSWKIGNGIIKSASKVVPRKK